MDSESLSGDDYSTDCDSSDDFTASGDESSGFSDWDSDMDSDSEHEKRGYRTPRDRGRQDWLKRVDALYDEEFKRFFRTPRKLFDQLADILRPTLERRSKHASSLRGGAVIAEIKLGVALRWLAGGSYLDIAMCHGVAPTSVNKIVDQVVDALIEQYGEQLAPEKFGDPAECERIAETFRRKNHGWVDKCIGAVDGLAIKICRPRERDSLNPKQYYNRKGFFALVLQAACDSDRKFVWASVKCPGATHDATAFSISNLGQ